MFGSFPIFSIIISFLLFFAFRGYAIFGNYKNDPEGAFQDPFSALYTVFIMFTVSNYPNVQLPYFSKLRASALYFWAFLCIGVFLLTNLLLAVVFNNYQAILLLKIKKNEHRVDQYFINFFD